MWVALYEPDADQGLVVTKDFAEAYCATHPGWTWKDIETVPTAPPPPSAFEPDEIPTRNERRKKL